MRTAPGPPLQARVLGGGPTGALAALALAHAGWRVELCDPQSAETLQARRRAYALTHSSRRLLERLDLWQALEPGLEPFDQLRLLDAALGRWVRFQATDLPMRWRGSGQPVGWIGRHTTLMALLLARLAAHTAVCLRLGEPSFPDPAAAADGMALVVAADGPASPTRAALGIGCWGWTYGQSCLTAELDLQGAAPGTAWELLRPEGPSALLPLGHGRFQLVWSAPTPRHRRREQLDPAAFLDQLAPLLPQGIEPGTLHDPARVFPVALSLAHRLSSGRTLLVGESGHRCHPVGGQGLNLCWRDVAVLHRLAQRAAAGRLAPSRLGSAYGRRRWADLLLILLSTDLLVRLFSSRQHLSLLLRRPLIALLSRAAASRRLTLSLMTAGLPDLRRA